MSNFRCIRCGAENVQHTMSKFNTDEICMQCKSDERSAPNYKRACEVERAACLRDDYNFQGIGLSLDDQAFLERRRNERTST